MEPIILVRRRYSEGVSRPKSPLAAAPAQTLGKFYAVARGRRIGLFTTWEVAKAAVERFYLSCPQEFRPPGGREGLAHPPTGAVGAESEGGRGVQFVSATTFHGAGQFDGPFYCACCARGILCLHRGHHQSSLR